MSDDAVEEGGDIFWFPLVMAAVMAAAIAAVIAVIIALAVGSVIGVVIGSRNYYHAFCGNVALERPAVT